MFNLFKKKNLDMWLLVGLGNPEDKYKNNRHNVGFMVMDQIADDNMFPNFKSKFNGKITEGRIGSKNGGQKVMLLKPMTYMNDSGIAVRKAVDFYKIPPEKIIVFHDELDFQEGRLGVKKGGGTGGHNGLRSIDSHLGDKNYWRVRLGIGHPGDKNRVSGYVLSDFPKEVFNKWEEFWISKAIISIEKNINLLFEGDEREFGQKIISDTRILKAGKN